MFTAPILGEVGSLFSVRIFDTARPLEVRQRITPGNAADEIESDQLSVTTAFSQSLLFSPDIAPNPFTPNGDRVNDDVRISYKLLRLTTAVPVAIDIYDLSGRLVKHLYSGQDPLGAYAHNWDGLNESGRVVSPGLYLYRISMDAQSGMESRSGVIAVAYLSVTVGVDHYT